MLCRWRGSAAPLNFVRPTEVDQALELLSSQPWTILAGGTDYYPALQSQAPRSPVLDISNLTVLRGIVEHPDHTRIGALTTWTDIVRAVLPPAFTALQQAALEVGSVQIQNRATIAGNLCNASPAADGVPALLVLDASVELQSKEGHRTLPLSEFIQGNRRTARAPEELVTAILLPRGSLAGSSAFSKLGARRYLVISIGMVAVRLEVDNEIIQRASVAIGSCSEVACRLPLVENALEGAPLNAADQLIDQSHLPQLSPISDIRATAEYRHAAALQLVRRTVMTCIGTTH